MGVVLRLARHVSGVSGEGSAMGQKTSTVKAAEATGTTTQTVCEWIVDTVSYRGFSSRYVCDVNV